MRKVMFIMALVLWHTLVGFCTALYTFPVRAMKGLRSMVTKLDEPLLCETLTDPETGQQSIRLGDRTYSPGDIFRAYQLALDIRLREIAKNKQNPRK